MAWLEIVRWIGYIVLGPPVACLALFIVMFLLQPFLYLVAWFWLIVPIKLLALFGAKSKRLNRLYKRLEPFWFSELLFDF